MQVALSFLRIFLIILRFFPVIKYNFICYAGPASFAAKLLSSYSKNPNSIQQVLSLAQLSRRLSYILIPKLSLSHCQILKIIRSESLRFYVQSVRDFTARLSRFYAWSCKDFMGRVQRFYVKIILFSRTGLRRV